MYHVIAFYLFTPIDEPHAEVKRQKNFLSQLDTKGRIYISEDGINGQMSASEEASKAYIDWMKEDARYKDIDFKIHLHTEHAFDRLTIKYRKELAALDLSVDTTDGAEHLSAEKWAEIMDEKDPSTIVIDVRNNYESDVGHFEGAICPDLETFRQFPDYIDQLAKEYNPETTRVLMYCTGGIRCELFSPLMRKKGFKQTYQLDGGVIKYGQSVGKKHWEGKLFVFDDRMVVPISDDNDETISHCHNCGANSDTFYNCAHMECNKLFLSCPQCAEALKGCCSVECTKAKKVRPFDPKVQPKPYRRLSREVKDQLDSTD